MITGNANTDAETIEELLSEYDLGASTRRYLFSLRNWLSSKPLTFNQKGALYRIRERATNRTEPTIQWKAMWDERKRETALICAKYYIENPPYFDWLSHNILNNSDFIPTQEEYEKITTNKYAVKVLNAYHSDAKYQVGDLVKACYTFYDYYYPEEDDDLFHPWLGIVVLISYDTALFGDEPLYEIVCTDGYIRWFSEFELMLVNKS